MPVQPPHTAGMFGAGFLQVSACVQLLKCDCMQANALQLGVQSMVS